MDPVQDGRRVFRRSTGARVVGTACALLFTGGAVSAAAGAGAGPAFFVLLGLAALSLVNLAGAWADRFILDDGGIEVRNAVWERCGKRPRRVAWADVAGVREHRRPGAGASDAPTALFLTPRTGRRLVLDALRDFDEARRLVRHHCGTQ